MMMKGCFLCVNTERVGIVCFYIIIARSADPASCGGVAEGGGGA